MSIGIDEVFGADGLLSRRIPGYQWREQQQRMAERVAELIDRGGILCCEAGTGTGKTFAYLVPALLSGHKTLVSTGTKNLQDQLFHRDLPLIREALGLPVAVALLKGRGNYLCKQRLALAAHDERARKPEWAAWLQRIRAWAKDTRAGDINELGGVPEDAGIWSLVTSTTENCLSQDCPEYDTCHLVEARKRAQEADLVVINHHLLCADFSLKDEGFGELLPAADCYIIDEAHQLPEVASNFFGETISSRQILDLTRDTEAAYHLEAGDLPGLLEQIEAVAKASRDLRLAFGLSERRAAWKELEQEPAVGGALDHLATQIDLLGGMLDAIQGRGKGLDNCLERCRKLVAGLSALSAEPSGEDIRWFETTTLGYRLNSTPLDIAEVFREQLGRGGAAWVFTSATLAVGESFEHFMARLGIRDAETAKWDSPFDYPRQALWFVPRGMPQPRDPLFNRKVAELAIELIEASDGRAFLLYTSHRALREAAAFLDGRVDHPLLVQGSLPKAELLERFREQGNAVLLGTASFWEGVDVRGDALSLVIIDKLPFASPGDPVIQARLDAMRKAGGNPFMQYQVPQAVIALKQGAGRLIRDVNDRGLLVVCDPRLLGRPYGHVFLNSMPDMARTRDPAEAIRFLASLRHEQESDDEAAGA